MPLTSKGGLGFRDMAADLEAMRDAKEAKQRALEVAADWTREHIARQFETSGAHGGGGWDFSGEEKYQRSKRARYGDDIGSKPLVVSPADAALLPSLIDPSAEHAVFSIESDAVIIGSSLPYAGSLLETGGVGPFGESFPARDPFEMTASQEAELEDIIQAEMLERFERDFTVAGVG